MRSGTPQLSRQLRKTIQLLRGINRKSEMLDVALPAGFDRLVVLIGEIRFLSQSFLGITMKLP